jgi:hypothetical protein
MEQQLGEAMALVGLARAREMLEAVAMELGSS